MVCLVGQVMELKYVRAARFIALESASQLVFFHPQQTGPDVFFLIQFWRFLNLQYLKTRRYSDECLTVMTYESLKKPILFLYLMTSSSEFFTGVCRPPLMKYTYLETEWLKPEIKSRRTVVISFLYFFSPKNEKKIEKLMKNEFLEKHRYKNIRVKQAFENTNSERGGWVWVIKIT